MTYFLGIDTGGTFTDAVLLDTHKQVVAAAKSLTTRFDLAVGIGGALQQLPEAMLAQVELVSLSTTLTTNSVVEGKGSPVCVLLAGYDAAQIKSSGLVELLGADAIVSLSGGHDAGGFALVPLDEASARAAILHHAPRVSAFAISASFGVRNPEHELQLRALVEAVATSPEGVAFGAPLTAIPYVLAMTREAWECPLPRLRPNHLRDLVLGVLPEGEGAMSEEMRAHPERAAIFVEELRVLYRFLGRAYGYERADTMLRVLRDSSVAYLENALRECAVILAAMRRKAKAKVATSNAAHRAKKAKRKAESKAKRKNR